MACKILIAALFFGTTIVHADLLPRDINSDGVIDAYYDTSQNLTFTADANLPAAFGVNYYNSVPPDGLLEHNAALEWPMTLDLYGVVGWRSAKALTFACIADDDFPLPFTCSVATSELSLLPTFDAFRNVLNAYWIDGLLPLTVVDFDRRLLYFSPKFGHGNTNEGSAPLGSWAVHDGDITAAIPEPETWALLVAGLIALRLGGAPGTTPSQRFEVWRLRIVLKGAASRALGPR